MRSARRDSTCSYSRDSESSAPALAPPIKDGDEDDDLDALFDEIQIGDK